MTTAIPDAPLSASANVAHIDGWQPLPARARRVSMLAGGLFALIPVAPISFILARAWRHAPLSPWLIGALALVVLVSGGALLARARWRRTFWKLDAQGLQVKRGLLWRDEILVPRSRVQHLDIERGPLERRFGLATLIVHTAGTRQHALRQSGLDDADAVALRDALVPPANRHDDAL